MEGLKLIIDDQITGYCPSCPSPDLYFSYKSGGGEGGSYDEMRYTVSCMHMKVCKYRGRAKNAKVVVNPFCGSEARGIVDGVVFCDCGADAPIEEWNRRVLQERRIGNSLRVVTQDEFPEVVEVVHDGNMRAYLSGQSRVN